MPVSPDYALGLAKDIRGLYEQAEEELLRKVAKRLARGIGDPSWAELKLLEVQALRRETDAVIGDLERHVPDALDRALRIGYNRGVAGAGADLARTGRTGAVAGFGRTNERAVTALARATQDKLDATHLRIRRWTLDTYQQTTQDTAGLVTAGALTRREAATKALNQYASRGVTGFVDRAGRSWNLGSYVEMATRTAAAHAAVQGGLDRLQEAGHDLVIVSDAPEECSLCRPWEGEVLSLGATPAGTYPATDILTGRQAPYTVKATLAEATGRGLFHPNCRHSTALYQPGVTRPYGPTADVAGDKARQEQRRLERRVRATRRDSVTSTELLGRNHPTAKALRARAAAARDDLDGFITANGRKDLGYRTNLRNYPPGDRAGAVIPQQGTGPDFLPPPVDVPSVPLAVEELTDDELVEHLSAAYTAEDFGAAARLEVELNARDDIAAAARANTAPPPPGATRPEPEINPWSGEAYDEEAWAETLATSAEEYADHAGEAVTDALYGKGRRIDRVKDEWETTLELVALDAEEATNGYLLRKDRQAEFTRKYGSDTSRLFTGSANDAFYYASEELRRYWAVKPRTSFAEFAVQAGVRDRKMLDRARAAAEARNAATIRAEETRARVNRPRRALSESDKLAAAQARAKRLRDTGGTS